MKGGCNRRGRAFHTYVIFKGIGLFLWSCPTPSLWPGVIGTHCLYVLHISCRLSAYPERAQDCVPHGSVACGLTHVPESVFYQELSRQQGSYLKVHGLLTSCPWLLSPVSHAPVSHRPPCRVVPFTCISRASSSQPWLAPVVAHPFTHPCSGTGFS